MRLASIAALVALVASVPPAAVSVGHKAPRSALTASHALSGLPPRAYPKPRPKPTPRRQARLPQLAPAQTHGWTVMSWYDVQPHGCYRPGYTPHTAGRWFVAHKTLPCGTLVTIEGPHGTATAPVADRGPYVRGRDLDASLPVFQAVCGAASKGLCRVRYST